MIEKIQLTEEQYREKRIKVIEEDIKKLQIEIEYEQVMCEKTRLETVQRIKDYKDRIKYLKKVLLQNKKKG